MTSARWTRTCASGCRAGTPTTATSTSRSRHDSLVADTTGGKAILHLTVDEGQQYQVGTFDIEGNRRFSTEELQAFYPFGPVGPNGTPAGRRGRSAARQWDAATEKVQNLYANNGYIYAQVEPSEIRRTGPDGKPVVDLRWTIREGSPATINKIEIVGNDVTHERVIREAIVHAAGRPVQPGPADPLVPERLQPRTSSSSRCPSPDVKPSANGVDVDIVFRVEEKRTGNINFGASLGQGTGVGGFLGLEEPNLFGRGKRGKLQWQFGKNINDFTLSYTDPAIRESRISGTVSLFDSRARYTVGDLGRRKQTGGSLQLGFPFLGSRYTRLFTSYSLPADHATPRAPRTSGPGYSCSVLQPVHPRRQHPPRHPDRPPVRDRRLAHQRERRAQRRVPGRDGQLPEVDLEGRWYAPLGTMGGGGQLGAGVQFVLGLTAKSGFIFGDAGPVLHRALLARRGAVRHPAPRLRRVLHHAERVRPAASGSQASPDAFGKSFAAFTVEAGARISQSLYVNTFFDAGNVYRTARQWDPTRLFRGAGFGAAVISPLGPIGIDLGYGFDQVDGLGRPDPGWQLHFKLGNFF